MDTPVKETRKKPSLPPGPGRPKGVPNKTTTLLKDAILLAAERAGGKEGLVGYLLKQAKQKNTGPFMALLGRVLPTQIAGDPDNPLVVTNLTTQDRARAIAAFVARTKVEKS